MSRRGNNPANVDLHIIKGNAVAYQFDWFPGGATGVDLSNYIGRLDVKRSPFNDDKILEVSGSTIDSDGSISDAHAAYATGGRGFTNRTDGTFGNGFLALNFGFSGNGYTSTNGSIVFQLDSEIAQELPEGNHHYEMELRGSDLNSTTKLARGLFMVAPGGEAGAFGQTIVNLKSDGATTDVGGGEGGKGQAALEIGVTASTKPKPTLGDDVIGASGATTEFNNTLDYKRWVDGDIYGLVILSNDDDTTRDDFRSRARTQRYPFQEPTGVMPNSHHTGFNAAPRQTNSLGSEGFAGYIIGAGAAGKVPDAGGNMIIGYDHQCEVIDAQPFGGLGRTSRQTKRPSITKFVHWDGSQVQGSREYTFAHGFNNGMYIDNEGKLKANISVGYGAPEPGVATPIDDALCFSEIYDPNGPFSLDSGFFAPIDTRIGELFFNSDDPRFDPDIRAISVARAADQALAVLCSDGGIRVLAITDPSSFPSNSQYSSLCYWDKDDVAAGFFTNEDGTPAVIANNNFASVQISGGGAGGQGVVVWAIDKQGNLFGADVWTQVENQVTQSEVNRGQRRKMKPIPPRVSSTTNPNWMTFKEKAMTATANLTLPDGLGEQPFLVDLSGKGSCLRPDHELHPAFLETAGDGDEFGVANGMAFSIAQTIRRIPVPAGATARMRALEVKPGYGNGGCVLCVDETTTPQPTLPSGITTEVDRPLYKAEIVALGAFGSGQVTGPVSPREVGGESAHPELTGAVGIQRLLDTQVRRYGSSGPTGSSSNTGGWTYPANTEYDKDLEKYLFTDEDDSGNTWFCPPVVVSHSRAMTGIMTGQNAGKNSMQALIVSKPFSFPHFMGSTLMASGTSFGNATYDGPPFSDFIATSGGTATGFPKGWCWNSGSPISAKYDCEVTPQGSKQGDAIPSSFDGFIVGLAGPMTQVHGITIVQGEEETEFQIHPTDLRTLSLVNGMGNPPGGFSGAVYGSGRGTYRFFGVPEEGTEITLDASDQYCFNWFSHYDPDYEYNYWDHTHCVFNKQFTHVDGVTAPGQAGYIEGSGYAQIFDWNKTGFSGGSTANPIFSRVPGASLAFRDRVTWWEVQGDSVFLNMQSGRIDASSYRTVDIDAMIGEPAWAPVLPKSAYNTIPEPGPLWDEHRNGPENYLYPGVGGQNASGDTIQFVVNGLVTSEGGHAATGGVTTGSIQDIVSFKDSRPPSVGFGLTI